MRGAMESNSTSAQDLGGGIGRRVRLEGGDRSGGGQLEARGLKAEKSRLVPRGEGDGEGVVSTEEQRGLRQEKCLLTPRGEGSTAARGVGWDREG
jgi:hypothetical protein